MPLERALKRGNVREFDQSYQLGFKSIWASEVDADLDLIFGAWNTVGPTAPTGAAGGDLGGTYPNPAVAKINGNLLGNTIPTDRSHLVGTGIQWQTEPYPVGTFARSVQLNLIVQPTGTIFNQVRVLASGMGFPYVWKDNIDLTIDISASGPLGLDTGIRAINTWYAVWVGLDPVTGNTTGIFSTSFTQGGLTLAGPLAAYTQWRRVGARRNNGANRLWVAYQYNNQVHYDELYSDLTVLAAGTATSVTSQACQAFAPPTTSTVTLDVQGSATGAVEQYLFHGDSYLAGPLGTRQIIGTDLVSGTFVMRVSGNQSFRYTISGGVAEQMTARVVGYEDFVL